MRAAVLLGFGGVDQIEVREVPEPTTGPGEIEVRVVATSINPIDWKLREGAKRPGKPLELPAILGRDASGEVVEVGPGVTRFRPWSARGGSRHGGLRRARRREGRGVGRDPRGNGPVGRRGLCSPLVTLTGSQLVEESLAPRPAETILRDRARSGASGGPQSLRGEGPRRCPRCGWAVRRSQKDAAEALGADGIVALDDEGERTGNRLPTLDGIADTIGASMTERLLDRVRRGGVVASVASEPKGGQERGIEVRHHWAHPDPDRLARLVRSVAEGALVIPIAKRFPLAQIREAQQLLPRRAPAEKVIVQVSDGGTA